MAAPIKRTYWLSSLMSVIMSMLIGMFCMVGPSAQAQVGTPQQRPATPPAQSPASSQRPAAPPSSAPAQSPATSAPAQPQATPLDSLPSNIPKPVYGPYDTIIVPAKIFEGELLSAHTQDFVWVRAPMTPASRKRYEEWTRLRNAVYVTYPYARRAGIILNDINSKLVLMKTEAERKAYVQSREKELKKEFTAPLEQMSIYQGKILMKLINRQTGNNCYNIIKDYRGGFTARFYQTVAFFFSTSLKQPYDPKGDDQAIEAIVQEVERMYRG